MVNKTREKQPHTLARWEDAFERCKGARDFAYQNNQVRTTHRTDAKHDTQQHHLPSKFKMFQKMVIETTPGGWETSPKIFKFHPGVSAH